MAILTVDKSPIIELETGLTSNAVASDNPIRWEFSGASDTIINDIDIFSNDESNFNSNSGWVEVDPVGTFNISSGNLNTSSTNYLLGKYKSNSFNLSLDSIQLDFDVSSFNTNEFTDIVLRLETDTEVIYTNTYSEGDSSGVISESIVLAQNYTDCYFSIEFVPLTGSFPDATNGMTLDATWSVVGSNNSDLNNEKEASGKVTATFNNTDSGILTESGAQSEGLCLYVFSGVLYFQCGEGSSFGSDSDTAEISYTIPNSTDELYNIEWSASVLNQKAALYVNGVLVGVDSFNNNLLAGADNGTIGEAESDVCVNRGGWSGGQSGPFSGTVTTHEIFLGEITSDITESLPSITMDTLQITNSVNGGLVTSDYVEFTIKQYTNTDATIQTVSTLRQKPNTDATLSLDISPIIKNYTDLILPTTNQESQDTYFARVEYQTYLNGVGQGLQTLPDIQVLQASKQIGDEFGQNMGRYVIQDTAITGLYDLPITMEKPYTYEGYPFYIYCYVPSSSDFSFKVRAQNDVSDTIVPISNTNTAKETLNISQYINGDYIDVNIVRLAVDYSKTYRFYLKECLINPYLLEFENLYSGLEQIMFEGNQENRFKTKLIGEYGDNETDLSIKTTDSYYSGYTNTREIKVGTEIEKENLFGLENLLLSRTVNKLETDGSRTPIKIKSGSFNTWETENNKFDVELTLILPSYNSIVR